MNSEVQKKLIEEIDDKSFAILANKGSDYANQDTLSNFKRLSAAASALDINVHTALGYALYMTLMKIDRINNLTNYCKQPKNESVDDSFLDGINYLKLAYCVFKDKE